MTPNPDIPFDELRLAIQRGRNRIPERRPSRSPAVNGFGYGGTNAHAILAEAPDAVGTQSAPALAAGRRRVDVFPLSARSEAAARELAGTYAALTAGGHRSGPSRRGRVDAPAHHRYRAGLAFSRSSRPRRAAAADRRRGRPLAVAHGRCGQFRGPGVRVHRDGPAVVGDGPGSAQRRRLVRPGSRRSIDAVFRSIAGWSSIEELLRSRGAVTA